MKEKQSFLMTENEVEVYSKFEIESDYYASYNSWYAHAAKAAAHAASAF